MAFTKGVPPSQSTPSAEPAEAPQDNLVIVDTDKLAATIAAAVAQTMANMSKLNPQAPQFDMQTLGAVIGEAVALGIAKNTRRRMTFGEYDALGPRNSYHPKSKAETPVLTRQLWQNDTLCQQSTLFDKEIVLANQITHSGRYFDRKVEVIFNDGENIYIRYNNKTADQRFELKNYFRSLVELLEHVVKEQKREDEEVREHEEELRLEREKRAEAKARHFGDTKASREAREAAAVEA